MFYGLRRHLWPLRMPTLTGFGNGLGFDKSFLLTAAWAFLLAGRGSGAAIVLNPDFSDGLNHWHAEGAVFSTGNQGVLTDDAVARSFLYQAVEASAGPQAVSFDFRR